MAHFCTPEYEKYKGVELIVLVFKKKEVGDKKGFLLFPKNI